MSAAHVAACATVAAVWQFLHGSACVRQSVRPAVRPSVRDPIVHCCAPFFCVGVRYVRVRVRLFVSETKRTTLHAGEPCGECIACNGSECIECMPSVISGSSSSSRNSSIGMRFWRGPGTDTRVHFTHILAHMGRVRGIGISKRPCNHNFGTQRPCVAYGRSGSRGINKVAQKTLPPGCGFSVYL